ncbi:MAG: ribonuclease HII [Vulcanimicrobiota bacterium]
MRQAYQWLYRELDRGRTRRSAIRMAGGAMKAVVKKAFKTYDGLVRFDRENCPQEHVVVGMDEVGRGPLAGPMVAACVRLPYPIPLLPFLRDSKKLSGEEREDLALRIERTAVIMGYGVVEAAEFGDELNLHHLTFLAMRRALESAGIGGSVHLLVDGKFPLPDTALSQRAVIKGDDASLSIAAASVLAKVYRDRRMRDLHQLYPNYGFDQHVGYGTQAHREAILSYGPCPEHRKNFLTRILTGAQ